MINKKPDETNSANQKQQQDAKNKNPLNNKKGAQEKSTLSAKSHKN